MIHKQTVRMSQCKRKDAQEKELSISAAGLHGMHRHVDWQMLSSKIAFLAEYRRLSVPPLHDACTSLEAVGVVPLPVRDLFMYSLTVHTISAKSASSSTAAECVHSS